MHLVPRDRPVAMRRLARLLEPGGRLVISVRKGLADPARAIAVVTTSEVEAAAARSGLQMLRQVDAADTLTRDIAWSALVFEQPRR
jgi:hypothetical protein